METRTFPDPYSAPPAHVKTEQADVGLEQLAFEIGATLEVADRKAKEGAEAYRQAGEMLLKAKAKVSHGEWESWVKTRLKKSPVHIRRYMRLAKTVTVTDLDEAWSTICGRGTEDEEEQPFALNGQQTPSRNGSAKKRGNRVGITKPASHPLLAKDEPPPPPEDPPLVKRIKKTLATCNKEIDFYARAKEADEKQIDEARKAMWNGFVPVFRLSQLPDRVVPPPKPCKCAKCHNDVLLVTSASTYNCFYVDIERSVAGQFDLEGGLAHSVNQKNVSKGDRVPLYKRHAPTCPKGFNGVQSDAPIPD